MWYWLANGIQSLLTFLVLAGTAGVTYLAFRAVRNAFSDTHHHD